MPTTESCPACARAIRLTEAAVGRKVGCPGCGAALRVTEDHYGVLRVELGEAPSPQPCSACGQLLAPGDDWCTACGARRDGGVGGSVPSARRTVGRHTIARRQRRVRRAGRWILALGVLFAVAGTFLGAQARGEAARAHGELEGLDATYVIPLDGGETVLVADLHARIDSAVLLVFGVHYGLAAVMIGLYFWSRRAPLPAILTALALYLVLLVLGAVLDPAAAFKGLLIKAFVIAGLFAGLKAALAERAQGDPRGPLPAA